MKRDYSGPGKEKKRESDEAMECFVGGVLPLMSEKENDTLDRAVQLLSLWCYLELPSHDFKVAFENRNTSSYLLNILFCS
jgi:hypothetical protein